MGQRSKGQTTAFVLSGGGNQGVSQVGMLRALLERGITPDVVIGTSAGALNGAALAGMPTLEGIDRLEHVWTSIRSGGVFPGGRLHRAWNILTRDDHLFSNAGLRKIIEDAATIHTFEELKLPLRVVCADLYTGEEVVLARGPLVPALLASSALPGVFPPIEHAGHWLVDGGVVNAVPISHALAGPVNVVYVLNVSSAGVTRRKARSPLDVVMRAFAISRHQRFKLEQQFLDRHDAEIVVMPRFNDPRELYDFSGAEQLIRDAYERTNRFLDERDTPPMRRRRFFRAA